MAEVSRDVEMAENMFPGTKLGHQWNEESSQIVAKEEQEAPEVTRPVSNTNTLLLNMQKTPVFTPVTREVKMI